MTTRDGTVDALLLSTLQRFVAADVQIEHVTSVSLVGGMSGSAVARHVVQFASAGRSATTSLITKDADTREWRVLEHLQSQQ